jgi:hypothetical protein
VDVLRRGLGSSQMAYGLCDVPSLRVLKWGRMNEPGRVTDVTKLLALLLLVTLASDPSR